MTMLRYKISLSVEFQSRYIFQHEKRNLVSPSNYVIFLLLYKIHILHKHTNKNIFNDFPKFSNHLLKICEDVLKVV